MKELIVDQHCLCEEIVVKSAFELFCVMASEQCAR